MHIKKATKSVHIKVELEPGELPDMPFRWRAEKTFRPRSVMVSLCSREESGLLYLQSVQIYGKHVLSSGAEGKYDHHEVWRTGPAQALPSWVEDLASQIIELAGAMAR
jgi:hypothetical protein